MASDRTIKMTKECFIRTTLYDKVKLVPRELNTHLRESLKWHLQKKFEGKCSYHGFIKPYSIEIVSYALGKNISISLNGDMEFMIKYKADVCNPAIGSIVAAQITKSNKFGHFAQVFTTINIPMRNGKIKKKEIPVLEIIIIKNVQNQDVYFPEKEIIHVEILGKKYKINEKTISAWGKYVHASQLKTVLDDNEMRMEYSFIPLENHEIHETDTQSSLEDEDEEKSMKEEESQKDDREASESEDEQDNDQEGEGEGDGDPDPELQDDVDLPSEGDGLDDYDDLE